MHTEVIVVGAGPAGLAAAACLKQRGLEPLIIDSASQVGSAWRHHYDRLHLHTHKGASSLPGLKLPSSYPRYPSREQFVAYLEQYAAHFGLKPSFGETITRIEPADKTWLVHTDKRELVARHVVIATGFTRVPVRPSWPGLETFRGDVLHSSDYKNGARWSGKRVLVVGIGNSGGEIAIDLHEHSAHPTISVRSPINVLPRQMLGLPILTVAAMFRPIPPKVADAIGAPLLRLAVGDFTKLGLRKKSCGPIEQIQVERTIPLIDIGTLALVRQGHVKIAPGIARFTETEAVFDSGAAEPFDAVVLATGYRPSLDAFLSTPTDAPGLHLCGFQPSTRGMLNEIGFDARRIAQSIATQLTDARAPLFLKQ